jgi:hypothetical protein
MILTGQQQFGVSSGRDGSTSQTWRLRKKEFQTKHVRPLVHLLTQVRVGQHDLKVSIRPAHLALLASSLCARFCPSLLYTHSIVSNYHSSSAILAIFFAQLQSVAQYIHSSTGRKKEKKRNCYRRYEVLGYSCSCCRLPCCRLARWRRR